MSDVLKELYAHQLKGIMFHSDLMQVYKLFGDFDDMAKLHYHQVIEETRNHSKLVLEMIDKTKKVMVPSELKNESIEIEDRPPSRLKRCELHKGMLQSWEAWEEKTINMYDNAISEYPDCKLLKIFRKDTEKELKIIKYKLGHI